MVKSITGLEALEKRSSAPEKERTLLPEKRNGKSSDGTQKHLERRKDWTVQCKEEYQDPQMTFHVSLLQSKVVPQPQKVLWKSRLVQHILCGRMTVWTLQIERCRGK